MTVPRGGPPYVMLANGKGLIAGGDTGSQCCTSLTSTAEMFDPSTATWMRTTPMHVARVIHTMTLLANGSVLVAGSGTAFTSVLNSAEVYDPTTAQWTVTPAMPVP